MIGPITSCCRAPALRELGPTPQCSACWGPVVAPHRLLDPLVELDRALERGRALRFGGRPESWGTDPDAEPHRRAVNLLCGAAADLAAAGGPDTTRRLVQACQRAVGVLVDAGRRGELDALLEAGELLDRALRAELAAMRRAAA